MGSPLLSNEKVTFVVTKPFTSGEKEYAVGDDFPQEDARNIEVLVRARYVVPVVEDLADRPKYWYADVKLKSLVLEKLARERTQLVMPEPYHEPDSDEVVNLEVLTDPSKTPEPEGEGEDVFAEDDEEPEPEQDQELGGSELFDPDEHTVAEVLDYLEAHPEDRERVLAVEEAGKARKGILES